MTNTHPATLAGIVLLGTLVAFVSHDTVYAYPEDGMDGYGMDDDKKDKSSWCMVPGMDGTWVCPSMENSCALMPPKMFSMWGRLGMDAMWAHHGMDGYDKGYGMDGYDKGYGMNDTDGHYGMDGYDKGYGMNDTDGHYGMGNMGHYGMDGYHKGYGMGNMGHYGMDGYHKGYGMGNMGHYGMDGYHKGYGMGNMGHYGMDGYHKGYGMGNMGHYGMDGYHKGYGMGNMGHYGMDGYHKGYGMGNMGHYGMDGYRGMDGYDKGYGMNDTDGHYGMDGYDKGYGMNDTDGHYGMGNMGHYGMDGYWGYPISGLGEYIMYDILSYAADDGTMTITGNAHASAEPETLTIRLGVQTTNPTAGAALSENSRLMTSTVEAITALGIPEDELGTSHFNIEPRYEGKYDENGNYVNAFLGYRVSNIIEVTTDQLGMVADIIDASVAAGTNNVISVDFGVSPETEKSTKDGLIGNAVCDAVHKAELALKPIGYRITGVETMHMDSLGEYGSWRLASAQIAEDAAFAGTPIFSGDQSFSTSVTITFLIGPW